MTSPLGALRQRLQSVRSMITEISWIHTLALNARVGGVPGLITLPILLHRGARVVRGANGQLVVPEGAPRGSIVLGPRCRFVVNGRLEFRGSAEFGEACEIYVADSACALLGPQFSARKLLSVNCLTSVTFGDNCLLSWQVTIMDSDFHKIIDGDRRINPDSPVNIGNNVWLGSNLIVLKGVTIADGIIVGSGSVVSKNLERASSIYGGNPPKLLRESTVTWEP